MAHFFEEELEYMKARREKRPMKKFSHSLETHKYLFKKGLDANDPNQLAGVAKEYDTLVNEGEIYFSVFAAVKRELYRSIPARDGSGYILYGTDPFLMTHLKVVEKVADEILEWSEAPEHAPEYIHEAAKAIEQDDIHTLNLPIKYYSAKYGRAFDLIFTSVPIFRKNLPGRKVDGRILPIIAKPDTCKNAYILPKKYWSKRYIDALW